MDTEVLKHAIKKFWKEKTDAELAHSLGTTEEVVASMRISLKLEHPKGTESFRDFTKRYLMEMSDTEKKEFMKGLSKEFVIKMSEGMAAPDNPLAAPALPVIINIMPQLEKVYGPRIIDHVPGDGEAGRLASGTGK